MGRPNRTYKLRVSPTGFDLVVDAQARLAKVTRALLPYGLSLHVALHHFAGLDSHLQEEAILSCPIYLLGGSRLGAPLFVGAPREMMEVTDRIITRLQLTMTKERVPKKGDLYLVALYAVLGAAADALLASYSRVALFSRQEATEIPG